MIKNNNHQKRSQKITTKIFNKINDLGRYHALRMVNKNSGRGSRRGDGDVRVREHIKYPEEIKDAGIKAQVRRWGIKGDDN